MLPTVHVVGHVALRCMESIQFHFLTGEQIDMGKGRGGGGRGGEGWLLMLADVDVAGTDGVTGAAVVADADVAAVAADVAAAAAAAAAADACCRRSRRRSCSQSVGLPLPLLSRMPPPTA